MNYYHETMELVGNLVDAAGVLIIVLGAIVATTRFLANRRIDFGSSYRA